MCMQAKELFRHLSWVFIGGRDREMLYGTYSVARLESVLLGEAFGCVDVA